MKRRIIKNRITSEITLDELFDEYLVTKNRLSIYCKNLKLTFKVGRFVTDDTTNNYCLISSESPPDIYAVKLNVVLKDYIEYLLNSNTLAIYFEDNEE